MHHPNERVMNASLSSAAQMAVLKGTLFEYTGDFRRPIKDEYFMKSPTLICIYDGADWGFCWIVRPVTTKGIRLPEHVKDELCTLPLSEYARKTFLPESPEAYVFLLTGEHRNPKQGELYLSYDRYIYAASTDLVSPEWIIKAVSKKERVKHKVCYTDGKSIQKYSFLGPVDWARLESDLAEGHAIEATIGPIYGINNATVSHIYNPSPEVRGFVRIMRDRILIAGWTKNKGFMGDYTFENFKGWWHRAGEHAALMETWRKKIKLMPITELFDQYNKLGAMLRKLTA